MAIGAYTRTTYADGVAPAISAANLNNIESQVKDISDACLTVGTWTPTIIGSTTAGTQTYSVQVGRYIKIGYLVFFTGHVSITAKDVAMAGNVRIGGLPYSALAVANNYCPVSLALFEGFTLDAGRTELSAVVIAAGQYISLYEGGSAVANSPIAVTQIADATAMYVSGCYISAT